MYKSKVRLIPFSEDDEIIAELGFGSRGKLTDVSVHDRARIRDRWVEVARWDNAHGFPHAHFFWRQKPETHLPPETTPTQLLKIAIGEILRNAIIFRGRMERA